MLWQLIFFKKKCWLGLWFQEVKNPWWQSKSIVTETAKSSYMYSKSRRQNTRNARVFWNLKTQPTLVTHQIFQNFLNSSPNRGLVVQSYQPLGAFLIQITTGFLMHRCLFFPLDLKLFCTNSLFYVGVDVYVCLCTYVQRPEVKLSCSLHMPFTMFFERRSLR